MSTTQTSSPYQAQREHAMPVANTSMLPGSETAPPAAVKILNRAVRGAHETIDRFAERAAPRVQQLGERVTGAEQALRDRSEQLFQTRDAWAESMRSNVRSRPLTSVAVALAVGALVAGLTRRSR